MRLCVQTWFIQKQHGVLLAVLLIHFHFNVSLLLIQADHKNKANWAVYWWNIGQTKGQIETCFSFKIGYSTIKCMMSWCLSLSPIRHFFNQIVAFLKMIYEAFCEGMIQSTAEWNSISDAFMLNISFMYNKCFTQNMQREVLVWSKRGAFYPAGENQKVVSAEFSTLSLSVSLTSNMSAWCTHGHLQSWKLSSGLVLLVQVCPAKRRVGGMW